MKTPLKILMVTNTYLPFTGGVPRSIETFSRQYRDKGNIVKIVAPEFEGQEADPDVFRLPALRRFNGSDFSVHLPVPANLDAFASEFAPDIIHAHHPFLLGNTALRLAARLERPLVFTFHTFYERYLHYLPGGDSEPLRRFVTTLAAGYANLVDQVIAPSESVAEVLRERGVVRPVTVIPTGIDVRAFASGDRIRFREEAKIPAEAFVAGFVSRLAPEKNPEFLGEALVLFLQQHPDAWFAVAGTGPSEASLRARFETAGLASRVVMRGNLEGQSLFDFYAAMDAFAFASLTETQGLVVTEAMAAGVPVVALSAPGVKEVVRDGENGRLLEPTGGDGAESFETQAFAEALGGLARRATEAPQEHKALREGARRTARALSDEASALKALALYEEVIREAKARGSAGRNESGWETFTHIVSTEWNLLANLGKATGEALSEALGEALSGVLSGAVKAPPSPAPGEAVSEEKTEQEPSGSAST